MVAMSYKQYTNTVLVLIEPHPDIFRVIRAAARKAEATQAACIAVTFDPAGAYGDRLSQDQQAIMSDIKALTDTLGIAIQRLACCYSPKAISHFITEQRNQGKNITSITMLDHTYYQQSGWMHNTINHLLGRSLGLHKHLQHHFSEDIEVVALQTEVKPCWSQSLKHVFRISYHDIAMTLLYVAIANIAILLLHYFIPEAITLNHRNKPLIYMISCAYVSGRYGLVCGLISALASFLSLHFFFLAPHDTLLIDSPSDALNLGLFLTLSTIMALLSGRNFSNRQTFIRRAERFSALLKLHHTLLDTNSREEAITGMQTAIRHVLDADVVFYFPKSDGAGTLTPFPPQQPLDPVFYEQLKQCWIDSKARTLVCSSTKNSWHFEPLCNSKADIGIMAVALTDSMDCDPHFLGLVAGVANQVSFILERIDIEKHAEDQRIQFEREKLRSMLLSSVSHDLKTPLASIIGSLSVYNSMKQHLDESKCQTLISTALDEAQRLDSFITNILDMTRIESGQITLKQEWIDPDNLLRDAMRITRQRTRYHTIQQEHSPVRKHSVEVKMDSMLTMQILQNLIDNAAKYTPAHSNITLGWHIEHTTCTLYVRDTGAGIPDAFHESIFDKYTRIAKRDNKVAGTGLGLAISRAIMHLQNGNIRVQNHPDGGALFMLQFPEYRHLPSSV